MNKTKTIEKDKAAIRRVDYLNVRWQTMGNWRDGLSNNNNSRVVDESMEEMEPLQLLMGRLVRVQMNWNNSDHKLRGF
uniref:Uncharacterized protein n=1 Tax=Cucumis melo TaxID=3656 RepID=A0A9I9EDJ2_CUCME